MLLESDLDLPLVKRGKVRDIYDFGDEYLFVATDRLSVASQVFPVGIEGKGRALTELSAYWFGRTAHLVDNHYLSSEVPASFLAENDALEGRVMMVKKAQVIPVECVVRGYLTGSAFDEYACGERSINGHELPDGLVNAQRFDEPLFCPSTKEEVGDDEYFSYDCLESFVGPGIARFLKDKSLEIYGFAHDEALRMGVIIPDTKFEFGFVDGCIVLIDELLTSDSSRFWLAERYCLGVEQHSLSREDLRLYLKGIGWDKHPPLPSLPADILTKTADDYALAVRLLVEENRN